MARNRKIPEDAPSIPEFIEVVYGKNFRPTDVRLLGRKPLLKEPNGEAEDSKIQTNGQPTKQVSENSVATVSKQTPSIEKKLEYIGNEIANFKTDHSIEMGDLEKSIGSRISKIENKFDKFASIENEVADSKLNEVQTNARLKSLAREMQNLRVLDLRNGKKLEKLEKLEAVENEMKALNDEIKTMKDVVAKSGVSEDVVSIISIVSKAVSDLNAKVDDAALKNAELNSKILGIDFVSAAQEELKEELKKKVEDLSSAQKELLSNQEKFAKEIYDNLIYDNLNEKISEKIENVNSNIDKIDKRMSEFSEAKNDLKNETASLKNETVNLKNGLMSELEKEIELFKAKHEEVEKKMDELSADVATNVSTNFANLSTKYEEVATRLLKKAMEKTDRKYARLLKTLTKKEKGPSRAKIVRLLKKLNLKSFENVLIISDKRNANFGELLFDVAKKMGKAGKTAKCEVVLVIMENKKKANEEPEEIVKEAMKKADFVVITAKHSLEKTKALEEFKAQGRKAVAISKSLKVAQS